MKYLLITIVGLICLINCAQCFGKRDYLEACTGAANESTHNKKMDQREVCNSDKGLECSGDEGEAGTCQCAHVGSVYQNRNGKNGFCVGAAGWPCLDFDDFSHGPNSHCVKNSKCKDEVCVCDEGYEPDHDDICIPAGADSHDKSDNSTSTEPSVSSGQNLGPKSLAIVLIILCVNILN